MHISTHVFSLGSAAADEQVASGRCAVLASTVSSKMLSALATQEGLYFEETLTGFKWLGNHSLELERQGYTVCVRSSAHLH